MKVFLRRIPANTRHAEIFEFLSPILTRSFLWKSGHIIDIEILALRDTQIGTIEYHGLVTLDSELSVQRVIKGLKNTRFNGRMLAIRPYQHRSWYNDPRRNQPEELQQDFIDKRKTDRRRGSRLQIIKNIPYQFGGSEEDFFRAVDSQQMSIFFIIPDALENEVLAFLSAFSVTQPSCSVIRHKINRFSDDDGLKNSGFQVYAEKQEIAKLLERLKMEFPGAGILYWVMPVVESGTI